VFDSKVDKLGMRLVAEDALDLFGNDAECIGVIGVLEGVKEN
jgi:hypothetical protein